MSRKLTALLLAVLMLPFSTMNVVADEGDPDLSINEISFSDDSPTGGDTVTITAEIANDGGASGLMGVNTSVSFYWDNNYIGEDTVYVPGSGTADAEIDWRAVGGTHTIKVIVDEDEQVRESDEENNVEEEDIDVAYPPILVLDDDNSGNNGGTRTETDSYYIDALENIGNVGYDIIRVESGQDAPGYDTLSEYIAIIWICGSDYYSGDTDITFTDNDKINVGDYLDDGGAMWVIGQDILYDFNYQDGARNEGDFEYDYLGISYVDHDRATPTVVYGVEGDPISDGVAYDADSILVDFADDVDPREGFVKVLSGGGDYNISTIRTEDDYKLVFMTIDFSSITETKDRDELMENMTYYLAVQLVNDVSLSRFNNPKNKDTIEPGVDTTINVTVRNRGTANQTDVDIYLDIQCRNDTSYRFMDDKTVSIDAGEGAFVEFEWETPDNEDYEYDIKARAYISDDEKEDNNVKAIGVDTYVTYDVGVSEARVDPMIAEKDTEREMSVLVTNTGDMSMTSDISGKVYDGAGGVVYNGGTQEVELSPGESDTLDWEWVTDEYGTFWFEAEVLDDDDEVPENDVSSAMMRSVDIEFSDDMESGRNGWTDYKSLSNPWHLIDTDEDEDREAASPTHAMWVGDESKGDGEYDNNWDFSLYTAQNIFLGNGSPQMSVNLWYSVENSWDGGNVQISTDGGESWTVIEPDGGYPDDAIVGLDNEPGYTATSGDGEETLWEIANFNLTTYSNEDVKFRFRFGTDGSVNTYEGWYIDDFEVNNETTTIYGDDFEDGDGDWTTDVVLSEWNYYSKDEEYGKSYSGDYAWYLGNPETGSYGASLNDSLESPSIDLGDGSEKYVSAMVWFGIDGPYDETTLEINISGEWETVTTFPGDDGDFSQDYSDADENGWLYLEADVSEYEGDDVSFRFRFESDTFTQYDGLYVDDLTLYSLPPLPDDVGTRSLDAPSTAKPGREVTFYSDIYNFGTADQDEFDVRGKITRDDGTVVYNETQTVDDLNSKDNVTLDWTWEGGPEGTYTIRVETLLDGDGRAGNNPKEKDIDIAESGYQVALAVQEQAKDVLSGESVFFNFTATNTGENSGYYDITVDYTEEDEWRIISHLSSLYLTAGSSQNFTVVVIAPTSTGNGDVHEFTVTVTSRDDPETEDSQGISATPFNNQQSGGDKVLLIDANFGKNNGYNNYYDIDEIDNRMKYALQQYFNGLGDCDGSTESCGYDVHTMPYDKDAGYGELHPYPTINLMSEYDAVIWIQGDHQQRNLTNWKNCISDYLDAGGNMWILGQNFMNALNSSTGARETGSFEYDYLAVEYVSHSSGTPDPLLGVDGDEHWNEAEYGTGDRSVISYDYADWIRPRDEAVGAFYTGDTNWWHIVDTEEDSNRKAYSPTRSMWIGDESKSDGEYRNGWDYSIYTSETYGLDADGELTFWHYYDTENSWDGGNVQISADDGENWGVIYPDGGYPTDSVSGLDGEPGYEGDGNSWRKASFNLSDFSGEDVRFRFRFGSDSVTDAYEGWYFDDVVLSDATGAIFSDDMEAGMANWDDAPQIFNLSLYYEGVAPCAECTNEYRIIVSPFTFAFINSSDERYDLVGRGLDWLLSASAADDVGVKLIEIESATKENSTVAFSSIIMNYGSEPQGEFSVKARIMDANGDELWSDTKDAGPLSSGDEETLEWVWESGNPGDFTVVVETLLEDDENSRNDLKEVDIEIVMVHLPEVSTFNDYKEGEASEKIKFDMVIRNGASGTDEFEIEMTGSASNWGTMYCCMELDSDESRDVVLQLTIPDDTSDGNYYLYVHVTAGDVTETLELIINVTTNPANYGVGIELNPTHVKSIAGEVVDFTVTIHNTGDANDTYDLEVAGDEDSWVDFSQNEIFIVAGGEKTVSGIVSIPGDANGGNTYIVIRATSRNDQEKLDEEVITVEVEKLETGATFTRIGDGLKIIEPGSSDTFEFTLVSDGNSEQEFEIMVSGEAGEWATSSISNIIMEAWGGTTFNVTVAVPAGTVEATYELAVLIIGENKEGRDEEFARLNSNVVVKAHIEEVVDVEVCLTDIFVSSEVCLPPGEFEITIEAYRIQTASIGFLIENRGNVDVNIALELMMPDGSTGSDLYFDENSKEWRVAVSPTDTVLFPLEIDEGEAADGTLAVVAREVLPGSYTFTLRLMLATETNSGSYVFETLEEVTVTVIVEGDAPQEESSEEDDPLLPGPSLLSVILVLVAVVYRRRR